jgi:alcohol dehydrogenase
MTIYSDFGGLSNLGDIVKSYNIRRVLVVTGSKSFESSEAKAILSECLKGYQVTYFSDFEVNPRLIDAQRGVKLAIENTIELIISIGGGSVLDMGKLIKALYSNPDEAINLATGVKKVTDPNIPLVAIPTTAGSGSESTHFAVVYVEGEKYSLADKCLLPADIILDGNLTLSSSRYQKACNVLDALSQSIESAWAVGSTAESQILSFSALELCIENFLDFVNEKDNCIAAQAMIMAANLAGQAINITKTTAAHAWSYGITKNHDVPHGHAVWLTLPKIFALCDNSCPEIVVDSRGHAYLLSVMDRLKNILNISPDRDIEEYFSSLLSSIGVKGDMANELKIGLKDRAVLSKQINMQRMANNPISFDQTQVDTIFQLSE